MGVERHGQVSDWRRKRTHPPVSEPLPGAAAPAAHAESSLPLLGVPMLLLPTSVPEFLRPLAAAGPAGRTPRHPAARPPPSREPCAKLAPLVELLGLRRGGGAPALAALPELV